MSYDRRYFEGGLPDGSGYKDVGYQQFPVQFIVLEKILERKPESVLDIGGARGYIAKMLQQKGVKAWWADVSEYCESTRVTEGMFRMDVTSGKIPLKDKEVDLVFSISTLEHLDQEAVIKLIPEIARVGKRALLAPSFYDVGQPDLTHKNLKPKEWWERMFQIHAPGFPVEIIDKEEFEKGDLKWQAPQPFGSGVLAGRYVKEDAKTLSEGDSRHVVLNIGSYIVQFRSTEQDCVVNMDVFPNLVPFAQQWGTNYVVYRAPDRLPLKDESVDAIVCSHMLEHLSRQDGKKFLTECFRVLKPSGLLRVSVPDTHKLVDEYTAGSIKRHGIYNVGVENAEDSAEALFHLLLSGHQTVYDGDALVNKLKSAGFPAANVRRFNEISNLALFRTSYDMYPELSLYVEATKGMWGEGVTGLMIVAKADELAGLGEVIGGNVVQVTAVATTSGAKQYMLQYLEGKAAEGGVKI